MAKVVLNPAGMRSLEQAVVAGGMANLARVVKERAVANVRPHRRTGDLEDSAYVGVFVDGRQVVGDPVPADAAIESGVVVGFAAPYARFVHGGTRDTKPIPFLGNAVTQTTPAAPGLIASGTRPHLS